MCKGWLIYNSEDYKKNKVYAQMLIEYGKEQDLEIELVIREELILGIGDKGLFIKKNEKIIQDLDFAINRSRDSELSRHLEYMNCKVFNSSKVTEIANDKGATHQFVNRLSVKSVATLLYDKKYMKLEECIKAYPVIIKSIHGHGGEEVYKAKSLEEAKEIIENVREDKLLIQELCSKVGVDVRVFVIGNEIIGAIKRSSKEDFRSNYSLGGEASWYVLNQEEKQLVYCILEELPCDFVGIDFMIDASGQFIFNEIEDAVGSRTLYTYGNIDSARLYIEHIKRVLS